MATRPEQLDVQISYVRVIHCKGKRYVADLLGKSRYIERHQQRWTPISRAAVDQTAIWNVARPAAGEYDLRRNNAGDKKACTHTQCQSREPLHNSSEFSRRYNIST